MAERFEQITKELNLKSPLDIASIELFAKWRNIIVHDREDAMRGISNAHQDTLLS